MEDWQLDRTGAWICALLMATMIVVAISEWNALSRGIGALLATLFAFILGRGW